MSLENKVGKKKRKEKELNASKQRKSPRIIYYLSLEEAYFELSTDVTLFVHHCCVVIEVDSTD